jgi:transcriptional regulator with XRE-family HTH domain
MQREINLLTEAQSLPVHLSDDKLVRQCKNGAMALRQTIANTGLSQDDLAKAIGKQKKVLSRALNGGCGLPVDALIKLCKESDSAYLIQYMCKELGGEFRLISDEELEIIELKERLALIESRRAA